ncbi:MAG: hypothetical protein HZB25_12855 [Candidatus Eisenbacteria bacterium]|nr:hypothetical protein [Candidatus Eisenbacteria bacterium]
MNGGEVRAARAWLVLATAWLAVHALAGALPLRWCWGLGSWALYAPEVRGALTVAGALALALAGVAIARAAGADAGTAPGPTDSEVPRGGRAAARHGIRAGSGGHRASRLPAPGIREGDPPRRDTRRLLLLAPVFAAAAWLCRDRTHILGDGLTRLVAFHREHGAYKAPLDYLVNYRIAKQLGEALGGDLGLGQALISIACGTGALLLLPGLLRGAGVPRGSRLLAGAVFLLSGWVLLFCGYFEAYPLYMFLLLAFLWVGLKLAGHAASALALVPLWLLALGSHFGAVLVAPALLWAPLGRLLAGAASPRGGASAMAPRSPGAPGGGAEPAPPARDSRARWLAWAVIALLAVVAVVALFFVRVGRSTQGVSLAWFLFTSLSWSLRQAFDTPAHMVGYFTGRANVLLLVWGATAALLPFAARALRRRGPADAAREGFLALAALGGLGALAYNGTLGAGRDWDLLAASLVPAQLWLLGWAARGMGRVARPVLAASAALALLHAGPWVASQASPALGREWVLRLWEAGPELGNFTDHERILLGGDLMDAGAWERAAVLYERRAPVLEKDGPRLRVLAARAWLAARRPDRAARACEEAWRGGRRSAPLEKLAVALILDPGIPVADSGLASRARELARVDSAGSGGRFEEVLSRTAAALERWPGEAMFLRRRALGLLSRGRGAAALERARVAAPADSGDGGGWSDLAHVCAQLGLEDEARTARRRAARVEAPPED